MTRIEQQQTPATIVSRESFDHDWAFGFVCLEFNPPREEILRDSRTGREIRRHLDADITYRCVRCQFDNLDKKELEIHMAEGVHPWPYGPFQSPYGHIADVEIEGIDDYQEFLNNKEK